MDHTNPTPQECFDIFNNAPVGMFISSPEGQFLSVNPALARMNGHASPKEMLKTIKDIYSQNFVNPAERHAFKHLLNKQGEITDFKYHLFQQGQISQVSSTIRSMRDTKGKIHSFHGYTFAVDEQINLQDAFFLRNHIFETSMTAISISDADGVITEANLSFPATWGYSDQSNVIGRHMGDFHLDHQKVSEIFSALNETGVWEGEFIGLKKDASTFIAYGHATRINGKHDHFLGYQWSVINVTQWKQANEELLQSEEKYRSLIEQSVDMMFLLDLSGNFLDVNKAAITRSGYKRSELLRMNVFDVFSENTCRDDILRWWANMRKGQSITLEAHHTAKTGDEYPVEIKAGKVRFGGKDYIPTLVRDIT
jgi:PAS domain S-box-containing protein